MELNYQTIKNDCVSLVAHAQTVVNSEVSTAEKGGVGKLLSVNADIGITSQEAVQGQVRIGGKVTYKIVYLDREGKVGGLDYFGEFDAVAEDERIAVGNVDVSAGILDAQCQIAGDELRLSAVCDLLVYQIVSHEDNALVAAPCECLQEEVQATALSPLPEAAFEVVEEIESGCTVDRVLLFDAKAIKTGATHAEDTTVVEGVLYADVVFLCQGTVRSTSLNVPFSEEMDIAQDCDLSLRLKSARLVLTGEDDNNVLRVEAVLGVKGYAVQHTSYTLVKDLFCQECDVVPKRDCFVCRVPLGEYSEGQRVSAPIDLDGQRSVAAFVSRVNVASLTPQEHSFVAEGLAVVGVLYEDGQGALQAQQVEIPFSVDIAAKGVDKDALLQGRAIGQEARVGSHGEVVAQLLFAVSAYRPQQIGYIVDVEQIPYAAKQAVASVYFAAPQDTLWDVAHAVHVSPAQLVALNPSLQEPASETRRVLVFRHRDLD